MVFFRVTQNINVKTTDGTLVKYFKFKMPSDLNNETAYITTYDDFEDLKTVFKNVDAKLYHARLLKEEKVRQLEDFPIELGISNENEHLNYAKYQEDSSEFFINDKSNVESFLQDNQKVDLFKQLIIKKSKINVAFIGSLGDTIGQMICSCTALRIFYNKLKEVYDEVLIDVYLNASNNTYFSRDKQIYLNQDFINKVHPLSLNVKRFCTYDYFVDNSMVSKNTSYYSELNHIDAWLYKFGIDFTKISKYEKYNQINIEKVNVKDELKLKLTKLKRKGKLLLYHPYSADPKKSIPQEYAVKILKNLLKKHEDYLIITTLNIDSKFKDDRLVNFNRDSQTFQDLTYIVSCMDCMVTTHTATMHLSDAFMIPTVVISTSPKIDELIKYYDYVKAIKIEDSSKSMSKFIFENDSLTFYRFESWKKLKTSKIIKLLETF